MDQEVSCALELAGQIADASRQILIQQRQLSGGRAFVSKEDNSPVTDTDVQVEATIRRLIKQRFPAHGILGEEAGAEGNDRQYVWVVDPIDGTRQFIAGIPVYGTLLALCQYGRPVLGVIDIPAVAERWVGAAGIQTTLNGQPVRTRACGALNQALMSSSNTEFVLPQHQAGYRLLQQRTQWRVYGAACYAYGALASGRIDLSIDSGGMREVDYCALVPVIEGAGGAISDWDGKPLTLSSGSTVVAAGDPVLHHQAIELLASAR